MTTQGALARAAAALLRRIDFQPIRAPSATTTAPRRTTTTTTTTSTLALASSAMARVSRLALQTRSASAMAASSASRKGFLASFTRGYSGYLSNNPRRGRLDFGRLENYENALYGLMGVNAVVFASWQVVSPTFMLKHFACSTEAIRNLRPHTLLTSMFSQFDFGHFAVNMLGLYFWGRDIGQLLGGRRLLALYLAGGLAGTVVQVGLDYANQREYKWGQPRERYCLGASGAVNAIVTLNILLFPKSTVLLYFFIPVPAALLGGFFIARDFSGLFDGNSGTSHAGHLGGAAAGLLYWLMRFRRFY